MEQYDERMGIVDLDKASLFVPFHITLMEQEAYTATEKMVYLALKSFSINSSICFPSQAKVMHRAGIKSNKTLTTIIKSLEEKGVLLCVPEFDNNNKRKSNTYYLAQLDHETGLFKTETLDKFKRKKMMGTQIAETLNQGARKGTKKGV